MVKRQLRAARVQPQDTHGLSSSETLDRMDRTPNVSNAVAATTITIWGIATDLSYDSMLNTSPKDNSKDTGP